MLPAYIRSCAVLAVANIDAGFVAGAFAAGIANLAAWREITNQHQDSVINQYAPHLKYVEP
uniref:Uncharacterized protein n=1 Tax=Candidatus Methanogaster sp. ANME-2c ERB4 TaxID=2759911 RepID=A0A7G9YFL4_9EURY|nr:hypothetical protein DEIDBPHB_00047 [Methanosarcinales archaeon ANME-2c ERB4]